MRRRDVDGIPDQGGSIAREGGGEEHRCSDLWMVSIGGGRLGGEPWAWELWRRRAFALEEVDAEKPSLWNERWMMVGVCNLYTASFARCFKRRTVNVMRSPSVL